MIRTLTIFAALALWSEAASAFETVATITALRR